MNLKQIAKKLRNAANVLDDLIGEMNAVQANENSATAAKILKRAKPKPKRKLHWMRRPENKGKVKRLIKKMHKARYDKANRANRDEE